MGLANGHLVALALAALRVGSLAGSSVQTMRTLGTGLVQLLRVCLLTRRVSRMRHNQQRKGEIRAEFPELIVAAVDWVHRGEVLLSATL